MHPSISQQWRGDSSLPASDGCPGGTAQLEGGSAAVPALARMSQERRGAPNSPKTPVLHNCPASNKPEQSPAKGEPASLRAMQIVLPSIALGPAQRSASVQSNVPCFLLSALAGSQPGHCLQGADMLMCSSPWLRAALGRIHCAL